MSPVLAPASGPGVPGGPGVADPVGTADALRRRLAAEIAEITEITGIAGGCGQVYVSWFGAQEAEACPARFRAQGEEGWGFPGWSAPLAAAAVGRAALDRHLEIDDGTRPAPLETVRAWMRAMGSVPDCGVGDWVADRIAHRDDAALAATAAGATRWLAGFVRVLGWPLPPRLRLLSAVRGAESRPLRWRPPGVPGVTGATATGVTVASGADARLGRVAGAGDFALVVHRVAAGDDGRVHDRAAFEAVAGALAIGIVPAAVVVTAGDTGERLRVPTDADLLDRGAALVAGVVRQRAVATERAFDPADASPSPGCRHCPLLADCAPGRHWLAGPGRWRGGLPVI
jgi:hypothetical protein